MEPPAQPDPVLVTGGTGTLGRAVVAELAARGVPARVMSRTAAPGVPGRVVGDLASGAGLDAAVAGVRAVIHCATDPRHAQQVDVDGTGLLLTALQRSAPEAHLVLVSIVGCDANRLGYYRRKHEMELLVRGSPAPSSLVRATQFHPLLATVSRLLTLGPLGLAVRGLRFQPCDPAWVASHLVRVALGPPLPARLDLAGPEVLPLAQAVRLTARAAGHRAPLVVTLPGWGRVWRGFAAGSNLPGPDAVTGGSTYAAWLARRH
ncbi:MAG TPA: NAD(P)H-binding protein [Oryzihumus sp.]|nr:NAD(P)H-binding protein [Oryzihumus sp.]